MPPSPPGKNCYFGHQKLQISSFYIVWSWNGSPTLSVIRDSLFLIGSHLLGCNILVCTVYRNVIIIVSSYVITLDLDVVMAYMSLLVLMLFFNINGWYYILADIYVSDMAPTFITGSLNMGITIMCLLCVIFITDWDSYSCSISILVITAIIRRD